MFNKIKGILRRLNIFFTSHGSEQRVFTRLKTHHLIKYRVISSKEKTLSFVRNISAGGVLFYSEEELPLESTLEMKISIPPRVEPVNVIARIVRSNPLKKIGGYEYGVEFVHIDEEDREVINKRVLGINKRDKKTQR